MRIMGRSKGRARRAAIDKAFSRGAAAAMATANRGAQPRTVALGDAINALTGGPGRTNGLVIDDETRWMMRDPRDDVPFGPINPLRPDAIDPSRPDTKRPEPRLTEYPVAWNLPGSADAPMPWATLRAAAQNVDIMRRCISIRQEQLQGLDWSITLDDQTVQGMHAASAGDTGREDIEAELRRKLLPEIDRLTEFWRNPWKANGVSFEQWVNGIMEDHLVLDAVAIYPRMTYGGQLDAFELIDATTIKLLVDYRGARPVAPFPAFQQILHGFPRAEFGSCYAADGEDGVKPVEGMAADQLFYFREQYRSFTPYGYSAVAQALISARLYLRRQGWMLAEYDDGSTPLTFLVPDATDGTMVEKLTPRTRRQWEDSLNAELAGQTRARNRMKVLMPGMTPHQMQGVDERYKPDYDMHLIKMLAGHFGVTSTGLGFSESRGLGNSGLHEGQADVQQAATTKPDKRMIERIVNELMRTYQGAPAELRFKFTDPDTEDQAAEDAAANAQRARGTLTLNDDRKRLGKSPFPFPEADMPMVLAGNAWVPFEGMAARAEQAAEAEQALVDDQLATSEQQRELSAVEAEEVPADQVDKALELAAYNRWRRKRGGDARRPFICKALEPSDWPGEQVPDDVDFAEWVWVADGQDIDKAANDNWRTLARDSKGRWVKRGSMRIDALGPSTPDKPVIASLRADAERRRAAAARQLPVSDASSTMDGMTTPEPRTDRRPRIETYKGRKLKVQKHPRLEGRLLLTINGEMAGTPYAGRPEQMDKELEQLRRDIDAADLRRHQDPNAYPEHMFRGAPKPTAEEIEHARAYWAQENADRAALNAPTPEQHDASVRDVVTSLQDAPGGWVAMADVRRKLEREHGMDRGQQDAAIRRLVTTGDRALNTAPEDNQKTLTEADHAAAVDLGAGPQHVLSLDPPRAAEPKRYDVTAIPGASGARYDGPLRGDDDVMDLIEDMGRTGDGYASLEALRARMGGTHDEQTAALKRMDRARLIALDPDPLRATMTPERQAAAIQVGPEAKHLVRLMESREPRQTEQAQAARETIDSVPGLRAADDRVNIGDPASAQRWMDETGDYLAAAQAAREANPHVDAKGRRWIEGADGLWRDGNGSAVPRALLPAKAEPTRDSRIAAALADIPEVRQTTRGRGKAAREAFSAAGFLHDTREAAESARRAEAERLVDREDKAAELDRAAIEAEARNDAEGAALARADRAQMRYEDAQSRTDHLGDLAEALDTDEARARYDAAAIESDRLRAEADAAERAYSAAQRPRLRAEQDAADQRARENLARINAERVERERKAAESAAAEVERKAREREENARRVAQIQAETRAELARRTPEAFALMLDGGDKATTHAPSRKILTEMREQGWIMTHMNGSMMRFEAPDGRAIRMTYGKDRVKWERGDYKGNQTMGESISLTTAAALVNDKPAPAAGWSKTQRAVAESFDRVAGEFGTDPEVAQWRARALDVAGDMDTARGDARVTAQLKAGEIQREFSYAMAGARAAKEARAAGGDESAARVEAAEGARIAYLDREITRRERQIRDYSGETRKMLRGQLNEVKAQRKAAADRIEAAKPAPTKRAEAVAASTPDAPKPAQTIESMMAQQMASSTAAAPSFGAAHGTVTNAEIKPGTRLMFRGQHVVEALESPRRAAPDSQGRAGKVFRVRREDQGVEGTMRVNDGERVALAAPKGSASPAAVDGKRKPETIGTRPAAAVGGTLAQRQAVLGEAVTGGVVGERKLGGGQAADTKLVTLADGTKAVYKVTTEGQNDHSPRDQVDAEELAGEVAAALGVRTPAMVRTGPTAAYQEFMPGQPGKALYGRDIPDSVLTSDDGVRLGLLDHITANSDRHGGNWLVDGDGSLTGIDNGMAFDFGTTMGVHSPFGRRHFEDDANPLSPADIARVRERLAALRPRFVALRRGAWHKAMMARLDEVARGATGTRDLIL